MLAFLHTAPVHIETFERLMVELAPNIPTKHWLDESLLANVVAAGSMTPPARASIQAAVGEVAAAGARLIVCTCSTIGAVAEAASAVAGTSVLRVDRAMAAQAVASGNRLLVAAALVSTLRPTLELLADEARLQGRALETESVVCDGAWECFLRGDTQAYSAMLAERIGQSATAAHTIVLAQASMAPAAELLRASGLRVLSSPRPGAIAAIAAYRR